MPASNLRQCLTCREHKPSPIAFRDPGEPLIGRPSPHCADCRSKSPRLQELYAQSQARRAARRSVQRRYAARPYYLVERVRRLMHPDDLKLCPPVSGCGQELPLAEFAPDRYQRDGLAPSCQSCR